MLEHHGPRAWLKGMTTGTTLENVASQLPHFLVVRYSLRQQMWICQRIKHCFNDVVNNTELAENHTLCHFVKNSSFVSLVECVGPLNALCHKFTIINAASWTRVTVSRYWPLTRPDLNCWPVNQMTRFHLWINVKTHSMLGKFSRRRCRLPRGRSECDLGRAVMSYPARSHRNIRSRWQLMKTSMTSSTHAQFCYSSE